MGRTARGNRPRPRPVERIELNTEHTGARLFLTVVLLLFGAGMLVYSFMQLITPDSEGWITVEDGGGTCGLEFEFLYYPGRGEMSPSAEQKAVSALYSQLCRDAFELFQVREAYEGAVNLYTVNHRPNEVLEVDPGLYNAFSVVDRSGSRLLYLGPLYSRYKGLFSCEEDSQLAEFDPRLSEDVAREYREALSFANDPEAVRVELLGENRIRLHVSEGYLAYAEQEGIEDFIDFSWMRNAFVADFLADGLAEQGYTRGVLSSYDGFIRNLDGGDSVFALEIRDLREENVRVAAVMNYQGPLRIVSLRDYPANQLDRYRFYQLESGEIRSLYLDPVDGLCRSAVHDLTGYSREAGCGEILLSLAPVYIAGGLRTEELVRLAEEGIQSVFCQDAVIHHTDPAITLSNIYDWEGLRYTAAPLER